MCPYRDRRPGDPVFFTAPSPRVQVRNGILHINGQPLKKQAVGKAIGSERLQVEGVADKVVGSAKETFGKAKDAIHKATR